MLQNIFFQQNIWRLLKDALPLYREKEGNASRTHKWMFKYINDEKMKTKKVFLGLLMALMTTTTVLAEGGNAAILFPGFEAPDFQISNSQNEDIQLSKMSGKYVLVQFWASYDEQSVIENANMWHKLKGTKPTNLEMVSINYDPIESVYNQLVKAYRLDGLKTVRDSKGVYSKVYGDYELYKGFNNILVDDKGVIVAQNISPERMSKYLGE